MNKYLWLFFVPFILQAARKSPEECGFTGTVNEAAVHSVECRIVSSVADPYLSIRINRKGQIWEMDLSGISAGIGRHEMELVLMSKVEDKFEHNAGSFLADVKSGQIKGEENRLIRTGEISLSSRRGTYMTVSGDFHWLPSGEKTLKKKRSICFACECAPEKGAG